MRDKARTCASLVRQLQHNSALSLIIPHHVSPNLSSPNLTSPPPHLSAQDFGHQKRPHQRTREDPGRWLRCLGASVFAYAPLGGCHALIQSTPWVQASMMKIPEPFEVLKRKIRFGFGGISCRLAFRRFKTTLWFVPTPKT